MVYALFKCLVVVVVMTMMMLLLLELCISRPQFVEYIQVS